TTPTRAPRASSPTRRTDHRATTVVLRRVHRAAQTVRANATQLPHCDVVLQTRMYAGRVRRGETAVRRGVGLRAWCHVAIHVNAVVRTNPSAATTGVRFVPRWSVNSTRRLLL